MINYKTLYESINYYEKEGYNERMLENEAKKERDKKLKEEARELQRLHDKEIEENERIEYERLKRKYGE